MAHSKHFAALLCPKALHKQGKALIKCHFYTFLERKAVSSQPKTKKDVFWFGLTPDGDNAYDYPTFEEFSFAKIFDGKSLMEIWDNIVIEEINGCDPMEMVEMYLFGKGRMGAPQ